MIIIFRLAILYFKFCEPFSRMDILNLVEKRRHRDVEGELGAVVAGIHWAKTC